MVGWWRLWQTISHFPIWHPTWCISKWMANIQLANSTKIFPGIYFLDTYLKPVSLTISFHVKLALWVCAPFWNRLSSISTNLKPLTILKGSSLSWVAHHLTKSNQLSLAFWPNASTRSPEATTAGHGPEGLWNPGEKTLENQVKLRLWSRYLHVFMISWYY